MPIPDDVWDPCALLGPDDQLSEWTIQPRASARSSHRPYSADIPIHERLFLDNIRVVYHVARRMMHAEGGRGSLSDFLRAGMVGLQQAAESYDSASNIPFIRHATPHIRRAILYEVHTVNDAVGGLCVTARQIRAAEEELTESLGRRPNESEVAWCLDMSVATLANVRAELERACITSLRRACANFDDVIESFCEAAVSGPDADPGPGAVVRTEHDVEALKSAFLRLNEQERLVLTLVYYESLSTADVACVLRLSVPLVVQMRAKALQVLRRSFRPLYLIPATPTLPPQ
jgi:RNA polymerase sigma factor for flagellar operon FliA